jgi:hypothetical protein
MTKQKEEKPAYKKDYLYMAYRAKEYLWLGFAILSIILSIYELVTAETREEAMYFIGLTFLAGIFYSFNRYRRIRFEKRAQENQN